MIGATVEVEYVGSDPPGPVEVQAIVAKELTRGGKEIGSIVKATTLTFMSEDRRSGDSMRSVYADVDVHGAGHVDVGVGATDPAVIYMDQGTGVYGERRQVIRPRRRRAMRWPDRGGGGFTLGDTVRAGARGRRARYVFATFIRGVMPRHYFDRAMALTEPVQDAIIDNITLRIAKRI